jgi:hypothetical protein
LRNLMTTEDPYAGFKVCTNITLTAEEKSWKAVVQTSSVMLPIETVESLVTTSATLCEGMDYRHERTVQETSCQQTCRSPTHWRLGHPYNVKTFVWPQKDTIARRT